MPAGPIDQILRGTGPFVRYNSLSQLYAACPGMKPVHTWEVDYAELREKIQYWREKFVRIMAPEFRAPELARSDFGPLVCVEEALEGIPECYRKKVNKTRAPLRVGLNISRAAEAFGMVAIRGGATMAFLDLCRLRQQATTVEMVYGNGMRTGRVCHVRCGIPAPDIDTITRIICSKDAIRQIGPFVIQNVCGQKWVGVYQFHGFPKDWPIEFDFALDRIDTNSEKAEEARVMAQMKRFGIAD